MRSSYPKKKIPILLKLDPDVVKELDRRCGGPAKDTFDFGGRAGWITKLVYQELGMTPPVPSRIKRGKSLELPLHLINMEQLTTLEKLIVELGKRGSTVTEIVNYLIDRKVPPLHGYKRWHHSVVNKLLMNVLAKNLELSASK